MLTEKEIKEKAEATEQTIEILFEQLKHLIKKGFSPSMIEATQANLYRHCGMLRGFKVVLEQD